MWSKYSHFNLYSHFTSIWIRCVVQIFAQSKFKSVSWCKYSKGILKSLLFSSRNWKFKQTGVKSYITSILISLERAGYELRWNLSQFPNKSKVEFRSKRKLSDSLRVFAKLLCFIHFNWRLMQLTNLSFC